MDCLGRGVLVGLIIGRYHRPREEVRIFLLIDLANRRRSPNDSATFATTPSSAGSPATSPRGSGARGEVHRYVGDEVILTWTAEEGLRDAGCIKALFTISDTLAAASTGYEADCGAVADFGPVSIWALS